MIGARWSLSNTASLAVGTALVALGSFFLPFVGGPVIAGILGFTLISEGFSFRGGFSFFLGALLGNAVVSLFTLVVAGMWKVAFVLLCCTAIAFWIGALCFIAPILLKRALTR